MARSSLSPGFLGALAASALSLTASAQTALAPVEVPAPEDAAASSPQVRAPSAVVTQLDASQAAAEAKDTAALLAPAPGATVQQSGGVGQRQTVSLRGASPNGVLVLLDGVPLTGTGESFDLSRFPAALVDHLELIRGAGARSGPGGLGGVVNVVSVRPSERPRLLADLTQGSFSTTLLDAGGTGELWGGEGLVLLSGLRTTGDFSYRASDTPELPNAPTLLRTRLNNDALEGGGLFRFRRALGDTWKLDATIEGGALSRGLAGTVFNPTPDAREDAQRGTASVRATRGFDGGGQLQVLGYGRLESSVLKGSGFGPLPVQQNDGGEGLELWFDKLYGRHGVTALLSGGHEWLRGPTAAPERLQGAAMLGDELQFFDGDLALSGSVRVDQTGPFTGFSPHLGVLAQLPKGFELRANAGQSHRPPSFVELYVLQGQLAPNPQLRPERGLYADAALGFRQSWLYAQAGGFGALYQDLISYEYYPPALARPYNFQAAQVAGVEAELVAHPISWVTLSGSYTWLATQNLKDDPRYYLKTLPYRPRHKVHARADLGPRWLRAHASVLYESEQYVNRTETVALPARAFVDAGVTAQPWSLPRLALSLEAKNLLDVQGFDFSGYPLPPRALYLTLSASWDVGEHLQYWSQASPPKEPHL